MVFMASSGFGIAQIAKAFPDSAFWELMRYNTSHAAWIGGGAWDMIQPAFMFMVGMALPFSSSRRTAEGQHPIGVRPDGGDQGGRGAGPCDRHL